MMVVVQNTKMVGEPESRWSVYQRQYGWRLCRDYVAGEKDTRCLENKRQYSWRTRGKTVREQETRRLNIQKRDG